jgi:hypothetical protein
MSRDLALYCALVMCVIGLIALAFLAPEWALLSVIIAGSLVYLLALA